jgi:hypothetical protein
MVSVAGNERRRDRKKVAEFALRTTIAPTKQTV